MYIVQIFILLTVSNYISFDVYTVWYIFNTTTFAIPDPENYTEQYSLLIKKKKTLFVIWQLIYYTNFYIKYF